MFPLKTPKVTFKSLNKVTSETCADVPIKSDSPIQASGDCWSVVYILNYTRIVSDQETSLKTNHF